MAIYYKSLYQEQHNKLEVDTDELTAKVQKEINLLNSLYIKRNNAINQIIKNSKILNNTRELFNVNTQIIQNKIKTNTIIMSICDDDISRHKKILHKYKDEYINKIKYKKKELRFLKIIIQNNNRLFDYK